MAYTKTNWVDNVTPIDKDNLNKIEQGIYDNSASIDTINGALAPTENGTVVVENTEFCQNNTIKSAFNEILIKGNTTQEENPTPDNPQDINKVVGNVKININNANVFPSSIQYNGTNILVQRGTSSINKDEFSFTATGNDMYFGAVPARGTTHQNTYGSLIEIPIGVTNIYLQCSNNAFSGNYCCFYDKDKVSLGYSALTTSKEVPTNAKYCSFRIGVPNSVAGTTYKTKIMVSYSTINKYVRYQLQELPLELPVENLFENNANTQDINGVTFTVNPDKSVNVNGTATADINYILNSELSLDVGNYTISGCPKGGSGSTYYLNLAVPGVENVLVDTGATATKTISSSYQSNLTYRITIKNNTQVNNLTFYPMIEKGSKANAYTPYGTTPIELCKIGDYQDYFYKDNGKWYLHKEIGKVILNGSENWNLRLEGTVNFYYEFILNPLPQQKQILSDYYQYKEVYSSNTNVGIMTTNESLRLRTNSELTLVDFKSLLASNNVTVYYVLASATNTEITDTTLKSQLDAIRYAKSGEIQTNITTSSSEAQPIVKAEMFLNNINGKTEGSSRWCELIEERI